MILTPIFIAISLASDVFMLTFLNATVRELRQTSTHVVERRTDTGIAFTRQERHRQDRAA